MRILRVVLEWWTSLCEAISSIFWGFKENPEMIPGQNGVKLAEEGEECECDCNEEDEGDVTATCDPMSVRSQTSGHSVGESALDSESVNEFGICSLHYLRNTLSERGNITNTLNHLIESMEPSVTPEVSKLSSKSQNTAAIYLRHCYYKVVAEVAKKLGMKISSHEKHCDVIWFSRPIKESRCASFSKHQRANYFPESQRAVRKNNLAACLTKMWKLFPREYDFFPKSWSLPRDWHLMEKYSRSRPKEWFIVKPNNWGCGYGIYLTNEVTKVSNCGRVTSQVYIEKPFLIDGLKFDLRIYVLVTSCKPLRIFVFNEGLARFATDKYQEPDHQNKTNRYMHLTNYAVNKFSPTYFIDEIKGTLRRWTTIREWLNKHKIDAKTISASMDDVIVKTVIAMMPTLKYHYFRSFPDQADSNSCFQIFGFDIMLGSDLKVYVLEVNGSPQFSADVPLDVEMTEDLVRDTFNILNLTEKPPNDCSASAGKKNPWTAKQRESQTITKRRVEWENSHSGNFRKIYPNERNKYKKYIRAAEHFMRPL